MNPVLVAKIHARRGRLQKDENPQSLLRYLQKKHEKNFVASFLYRLRHDTQDLQYYLALWRGIKTLGNPCRNAMQRVVGTEIDLQNIVWAYRLKKYYGVFGDATYGYLVPVRHRLQEDVLAKIVACKDAASILSVISGTVYDGILGDFSSRHSIINAVKARYRAEGRCSHIALLCGYLYEVHQ